MGTTFTNLQIRTGEQRMPEVSLPPYYQYARTAQEWFTVYEESGQHDFRKMQKLGREISAAADFPVIVVSYLDDDMFELRLMKAGKSEAFYQLDDSGSQVRKGAAFIAALGLTGKEASAFRYLLKKEMTVQDSIDSFSRLLGARLFGDPCVPMDSDPLWEKDAASVLKEIAAEKKLNRELNKVDNHAVLILREEIPGVMTWAGDSKQRYQDVKDRVIRIVRSHESGGYDFSQVCCLREMEGQLVEIYAYRYPREIFTGLDKHLTLNYEHRSVSVMGQDHYYREVDWDYYEPILTAQMAIPRNLISHQKADGGKCSSVFYRMNGNNLLGDGHSEYRYFCGELEKTDWQTSGPCFLSRNVTAEYTYEDYKGSIWNDSYLPPAATGQSIVVARVRKSLGVSDGGERLLDVRFFDSDLRLLRREEIAACPILLPLTGYVYDNEKDSIYFGDISVNLTTHEVRTCSRDIWGDVFACLDGSGNIYTTRSHSLYVLNPDMDVISCHKFKGEAEYCYVNQKGNVCFITTDDDTSEWHRTKEGCYIRLYEVEAR